MSYFLRPDGRMSDYPVPHKRIVDQLKPVALSMFLVVLYFLMPPNREAVRFARERLQRFPADWSLFREERDPEQRLHRNFGMNYDAPIFIRDNLGRDDRLQLPPRAYVTPYCPAGKDSWTDPRFIYYVAGPVRAYGWQGLLRPEATHALVIDTLSTPPGLRIVDLMQDEFREQVTELYRRAERRR
jgi:hypothetical protein